MHEKKQGKFLDGFFWGAVIGGGLAYLLSTKKGRDLLKDLGQNGLDMLEGATMPEPEMVVETPPVVAEEVLEEEIASAPVVSEVPQPSAKNPESSSPKKRFFKAKAKS